MKVKLCVINWRLVIFRRRFLG